MHIACDSYTTAWTEHESKKKFNVYIKKKIFSATITAVISGKINGKIKLF